MLYSKGVSTSRQFARGLCKSIEFLTYCLFGGVFTVFRLEQQIWVVMMGFCFCLKIFL